MEIELLPRGYNDHYAQLKGSDPFSTAVNKKIADYWVSTGHELQIFFACLEVLADGYNAENDSSKSL